MVIFLAVASFFLIAPGYTRYGKFTYVIGANQLATRVSGINVERHILIAYTIAGVLLGLAGVVTTACAITGQTGMGPASSWTPLPSPQLAERRWQAARGARPAR